MVPPNSLKGCFWRADQRTDLVRPVFRFHQECGPTLTFSLRNLLSLVLGSGGVLSPVRERYNKGRVAAGTAMIKSRKSRKLRAFNFSAKTSTSNDCMVFGRESKKSHKIKSITPAVAVGIATIASLIGPAHAHLSIPASLEKSFASSSIVLMQRVSGSGLDSDGDGVRNQDDRDDDNDGIPDSVEGRIDNNGDGIPDAGSTDTDGDGTPDVLDLDSDNDGILDIIEARAEVAAAKELDQIPDGAIDAGFDVGENGIADVIETSDDSSVLEFELADTDGDGIPDFRDIDSDADNIYDVVEAGGVDNDTDGRIDNFRDTDGQGVDDAVQASSLALFDTDGDGELDFRDVDSDGDTIPDRVEGGGNRSFPTDTDGDGAPDYRDNDSDGDGISDRREAGSNPNVPLDTNGDGIPDYQDANNGSNDSPADSTDDNTAGLTGDDAPDSPADNDDSSSSEDTDESSDEVADEGTDEEPSDEGDIIADDDRPDRDGDGIANQDDLDDDNDGILDVEEGIIDADGNGVADANSRDTDGDGTPDGNDLDSDNDGILDLIEGRLDLELVGTLDPVRIGAISTGFEVGSNGVTDLIETAPDSGVISGVLRDTDGDGTPDYQDIDSDDDGIGDLVEAGGVDADSDGRVDGFVDEDDKGVDDALQASALPLFDTDGDGVLDYRDPDSDNDGLPDSVETSGPLGMPTDSDGDGAADYREQDSDNDGISDTDEAGDDPNAPLDINGDGTPDFQDSSNGNGASAPEQNGDHDGDGQTNLIDQDDDDDGIPDNVEGSGDADSDGVINSLDRDSDNDGILDSIEGQQDSDGDGVPNYLDLDSDNDGIYDALEASRGAISASGRLATSSVDAFGLAAGASDTLVDTDGDGVADWIDLDSDNDGLTDVLEALGTDSNLDARLDATADANQDGADDSLLDRPVQPYDQDFDRIPNHRDLDSDQDGISDIIENFGETADIDNDGVIDNFISTSGNGLDDNYAAALAPLRDTDQDGLPNSLDIDSDNDGISDLVESGGVDTNQDGVNDVIGDSDSDGIPDVNDAGNTGGVDSDADGIDDNSDVDFVGGPDSDGDGVVDSMDPDSDGNGFVGPLDDDTSSEPSQGKPVFLPDDDANGVPDINQGSDISREGLIETGLGGSGFGCSIAPSALPQSTTRFDPMLGALFGASAFLLALRRRTGLFSNNKQGGERS